MVIGWIASEDKRIAIWRRMFHLRARRHTHGCNGTGGSPAGRSGAKVGEPVNSYATTGDSPPAGATDKRTHVRDQGSPPRPPAHHATVFDRLRVLAVRRTRRLPMALSGMGGSCESAPRTASVIRKATKSAFRSRASGSAISRRSTSAFGSDQNTTPTREAGRARFNRLTRNLACLVEFAFRKPRTTV
jgi:hypothetical protein